MAKLKKFGEDRHHPEGNWVKTTLIMQVAGVSNRKPDTVSFARAVGKAEAMGLLYGVRLEPEPTNRNDRNAIKVIGFADKKIYFGGTKRIEWHVGYVPPKYAARLTEDLISRGVEIAAELYRVSTRDDFVEFQIIALAPPGYGRSTRFKPS